jgi:glycerol kinase
MNFILAIDQSTSATKALLFDTDAHLIDQCEMEHDQIYPRPGWVEHDAEEIYQNVLKTIRGLLNQNPGCENRLQCLSITNQRETFVVFERASGRPLYNAIVWQCRRGVDICESLVQAGYNDLIQKRTGLKIDTYFSASKLSWLIDNYPDIAEKLKRGDALIGTIDTYLIYRLTGGQVHATDYTNASRTLLYDITRLQWDAELCDLFHVPMRALPEIRESGAVFGKTSLEGILPSSIPISGVIGDSQASLFAQHCFEPGSAKVTFGTGSSILLNIGQPVKLSDAGIVTTIAWVHHNQVTYCLEGLINYSAATISWLKNQLKLINDAAETEELALSIEDNGGVYLVPAFVGLSAPYWQPNARAAIIGMSSYSTKNHIVRAALESIAYQVKDVLELMVAESGIPLQYIHADGGAVRNRFLMQFVADMIQYPVVIPDFTNLSALGAVSFGYLGTGAISSIEDLKRLSNHSKQYQAMMKPEKVAELYQGWKEAVRRVL